MVVQAAEASPDIEVVAGIARTRIDQECPFPVYTRIADCEVEAEVIVDFSSPEALGLLLEGAVRKKTALIIATSGLTEEDRLVIREKAELIPIFQAANMSLGVNLLSELVRKAAAVTGDGFDIEIIEKHHNLKKDAPSGTAYALAETINEVFLKSKSFVFGRHSRDARRDPREIGIHAVRGGTIVGEHRVIFAGQDEVLELCHASYSKQVFAAGALEAAHYLAGKPAGFYTMKDMITEHSVVTNLYTADDEALVSINGVSYDSRIISAVFRNLGEEDINIDMISQTAPVENRVNISFTLPRKDVERTIHLIRKFQDTIPDIWMDIRKDIVKITVEGAGMERQSGVAARVFEALAEVGIKIQTVTTSETKISCIVDQRDASKAVASIKKTFGI